VLASDHRHLASAPIDHAANHICELSRRRPATMPKCLEITDIR
jgi:hypothetical protein